MYIATPSMMAAQTEPILPAILMALEDGEAGEDVSLAWGWMDVASGASLEGEGLLETADVDEVVGSSASNVDGGISALVLVVAVILEMELCEDVGDVGFVVGLVSELDFTNVDKVLDMASGEIM